ncbi:MAG: hypothetical protein HQ402_00280 [Parcubacteria group bacterium]|nr:hypothetical protein [Parcubacteria group bacterium]
MSPLNWKLYKTSSEALDAMLEMCQNAHTSIDMEQYILSDSEIGRQFIDILIEKAKAGVRVRLLCDHGGSSDLYKSSLPAKLRNAGAEIRFFNIIRLWRLRDFSSWFFRDHRKILIIDQNQGMTGGVGIRDDMKKWRDTSVLVEGEVVEEMSNSFEQMWEQANENDVLIRIQKARKIKKGNWFITSAPYFKKRFFYHELLRAIRGAKKYIFLTTPYFIPDHRLMRVLRLASKRGVDVRIMMPREHDLPIVESCSHAFFEKLLRHDIKIFQYTKEFLHAKTAVVDDMWSTVGSFNLDSLSFFYNYEANIISTDQKFALEIKGHFLEDMSRATEVLLPKWKDRSWFLWIQEVFALPFRRIL